MKRLVFWLALICLTARCQSDKPVEPSLQIKPLVGTWRLSEILVVRDRNREWRPVPYNQQNDITFRPDGVILDYKEEGICCHPKELDINGSIELVNNYIKVPENSDCSIPCIKCQVWTISYIEGEMIITGCVESDVKKYKR